MMIQTTSPQVQTLLAGRALLQWRDEVWFECVKNDPLNRVPGYLTGKADEARTIIGTAQGFREVPAIVPGSSVTAAGKSLSVLWPVAALSPNDRLVESEEHDGTA